MLTMHFITLRGLMFVITIYNLLIIILFGVKGSSITCQNQTRGELTFNIVRAPLTVLISLNFITSLKTSEGKIYCSLLKRIIKNRLIHQCIKEGKMRDLSKFILWSKKYNLMGYILIVNKRFLLSMEENNSW